MLRFLLLVAFIPLFITSGIPQTSPSEPPKAESQQSKGGTVVFKIPEGVFPMDWNKSGFKGILMLRKDSPSGIFVSYPNDDEKIEDLRERAAKFIAPMFIRDEDERKQIKFDKKPIPNRKGDAAGTALYYSYTNEEKMVQILFYERIASDRNSFTVILR